MCEVQSDWRASAWELGVKKPVLNHQDSLIWWWGGGDALLNFVFCKVFTLNHQGQPKKEPVIYQWRGKK